jgi:hypothetical protein
MTSVQLPNNDVFKQYLLTLLNEDTAFKYTLIDVLFKDAPFTVMKVKKNWTSHQKTALAKKHAVQLEVIRDLQELFKNEPSAHEIIQTIQK